MLQSIFSLENVVGLNCVIFLKKKNQVCFEGTGKFLYFPVHFLTTVQCMVHESHTKIGPLRYLKRQHTRYLSFLEDYRACAGGLSAVNVIGTDLRNLIKLGTDSMAAEGINGRRRGKQEESRE